MKTPHLLSITEAREALRNSSLDAETLYKDCERERLEHDSELHSFLEAYDTGVVSEGILSGIPLALKDNLLVKGYRVSAGSKILEGYRAPYTATAVERLMNAGARIVGRTNMDEFAMGSSTENSAFGPTKNPIDTSRVPGGSSGGSAAAVKAGFVLGALGTDTGGSIRQPAAFCGIVGLKPTYGAVSRYGAIAMGSSLDQIGPFTRSVEDAELLFSIMKGVDPYDGTTENASPSNSSFPKVIGVPKGIRETEGMHSGVMKQFEHTLEVLKSEGYEIRDIELPHLPLSLAVYYIIMPAEVSSNLARFDGVKYGLHEEGKNMLDEYVKTRARGFGKEVRRRIILGTYVLSSGYYDAYYNSALQARRAITQEIKNAFREVCAIATPTTPTPAFRFGEKTSNPLEMYLADIFTVPANIAGVPAISIPAGTVEEGGVSLPVGFQLMADHHREDVLFALGKTIEKAYPRA